MSKSSTALLPKQWDDPLQYFPNEQIWHIVDKTIQQPRMHITGKIKFNVRCSGKWVKSLYNINLDNLRSAPGTHFGYRTKRNNDVP